jgi:hypothetical protein
MWWVPFHGLLHGNCFVCSNYPEIYRRVILIATPAVCKRIYNLCEVLRRKLSNCIIMWRREQSFMCLFLRFVYMSATGPGDLAWHLMSLSQPYPLLKMMSRPQSTEVEICPVAAQVDE